MRTPRATCQLRCSASSRSHSPAATAAYPSSNQSGSGRPTRQRRATWASSCRRAPDSRTLGRSDSSTIVPRSGNAAPSLQRGSRPRVSESNVARVGARISRMGRSGSGPTPGNGAARSAASASPTARSVWGGHATAVTRPTVTAAGDGACASSQRRASAVPISVTKRPEASEERVGTALGARRLLPLERELQRLLTLLAPGIELVRLEALLPGVLFLLVVSREPQGAPQLVVGLDQVGAQLERGLLRSEEQRLNSSHRTRS